MKTKAVRLYGSNDLRLEEFELPELRNNEVMIKVISDALCASTYKAVIQGEKHKRVPEDISENPIVIGHEMCGEIVKVPEELSAKWRVGQKIVIQPALKLDNGHDPGYSYPYIGGNMTYAIVPEIVLERNCLIPYEGQGFYSGSLVESFGCVLRGFKGFYHTDYTNYERTDGAKVGGNFAILGGAGPMGLAAIELAINYAHVGQIVVTDLDDTRLAYAKRMISPESAKEKGVILHYVNTRDIDDVTSYLKELVGEGFDDVFVMTPVAKLLTQAEAICREDGCINFFAGPSVHNLPGSLNLYRVHYDGIHLVGTAGSIPLDTVETIRLIEDRIINPAVVVSHIMGIDSVKDAVFELAKPSGAKKVCYTGIDLPLVAIEDFGTLGKSDTLFAKLDEIVKRNHGLWCEEAEAYLLQYKGVYGD